VAAFFALLNEKGGKWYNHGDILGPPNVDHPNYYQFNLDCIPIFLYHCRAQQTSLRNQYVENTLCNILNFLFPFSLDEEEVRAKKVEFEEMLFLINKLKDLPHDIRDKIQLFYSFLQTVKLSEDSQTVYNMGKELVIGEDILRVRKELCKTDTDHQLENPDAGFFQVRGACEIYEGMQRKYEDFDKAFKLLYERLTKEMNKFWNLFRIEVKK
jgi:hypothetical protein